LKEYLKQKIEHIESLIKGWYKGKKVLPTRLCPSVHLGKPTHIAHICKSHRLTRNPKITKEYQAKPEKIIENNV